MNKKKSIGVSKQVYALDSSIKRMTEGIKLFKELKRKLIEMGKGNYITREELDILNLKKRKYYKDDWQRKIRNKMNEKELIENEAN